MVTLLVVVAIVAGILGSTLGAPYLFTSQKQTTTFIRSTTATFTETTSLVSIITSTETATSTTTLNVNHTQTPAATATLAINYLTGSDFSMVLNSSVVQQGHNLTVSWGSTML